MAEGRRESRKKAGTQNREVLIWNYACNLLGRHIYSEKSLLEKLQKKFPDNRGNIEKVIEKLKSYNYLNDNENMRMLKESLVRKGYGPKYIRQYLSRKGFVDNDEEVQYDNSILYKWYKKKMGDEKIKDSKTWQKMYNYLLSKGFYSEEVIEFLKGWTEYER